MRAKWWLLSILAVAVIAGGLALRRKPAPSPAARNTPAAAAPESNQVTIQGKIRPQHVVGVAAPVPGFIEAILVEPGQDVFQGQPLARIGSQTLESDRESAANSMEQSQEQVGRAEASLSGARLELSRAQADAQRSQLALDRAERVFTRQQTLFREGATPRLTYQKAEADYEAARKDFDIMDAAVRTGREHVDAAEKDLASARKIVDDKRAQLEEAQQNLAASEVQSPVDGYLVAREGAPGKRAEELGDKFFTIATDLYALEVPLEPKPETLRRIIPGMPATVEVLDLDGAAFQGAVKDIKDNQVIVEFGSANPAVKPGMVADVRFKFQ